MGTSLEKYEEIVQQRKKMIRNQKCQHLVNELQDIKEKYRRNNVRNLYKGVSSYKQGYQAPISISNDKNGKILADKIAILEREREYFVELLNCPTSTMPVEQEILHQLNKKSFFAEMKIGHSKT